MDPLNPGLPPKGLSDDALLDAVSRAALDYFWSFAHPVSGMARERSGGSFGYDTDATVTTGGTGFGIMAMLAGAARGWLDRAQVAGRIGRIVDFLEVTERHHGVFPHFMNGETGRTIPFSRVKSIIQMWSGRFASRPGATLTMTLSSGAGRRRALPGCSK